MFFTNTATLKAAAKAFEETLRRRNQQIGRLSAIIHNQRLELAKRLTEIARLKIDLEFKELYDGASPEGVKQESPEGQTPQAAERKNATSAETDRQA